MFPSVIFIRLGLLFGLFMAAMPAFAQPRLGLGEHPTMNGQVQDTHFIYLALGNRYEYRISHTRNGQTIDPAYLRFTVINEFNPVAGADDYMVKVEIFGAEEKIREANCYHRLQRGRIYMFGVAQSGFNDCNFQSPFSQQDADIAEEATNIVIGGQSVAVPATGRYEHFWGDQNGDNGFISFRFARGIGLVRYESRTSDSPLDMNPVMEEWVSELQYARVNGTEYGVSEIEERFGPQDVIPDLTPAQ